MANSLNTYSNGFRSTLPVIRPAVSSRCCNTSQQEGEEIAPETREPADYWTWSMGVKLDA